MDCSYQCVLCLGPAINFSHEALQTEPSHRDLLNLVAAVIPNKWKEVGIQLGLSPGELDVIYDRQNRDAKKCYMDVFDTWKKEEKRTWASLIEALSSPYVSATTLATEISKKIIERATEKAPSKEQY